MNFILFFCKLKKLKKHGFIFLQAKKNSEKMNFCFKLAKMKRLNKLEKRGFNF